MIRYEYPRDRKDFALWVKAAGPTVNRYWWFDDFANHLTIELRKSGKIMGYRIEPEELQLAGPGWRRLVAMAVRRTRKALAHHSTTECVFNNA